MRPSRALAALLAGSAAARDLANCTRRVRVCNGDYLCTDICPVGAVIPDPWATRALAFQRRLQRDEPLARATFLGTHNSAISQAYGFGVEMDGIERLLNETLYRNDDVGEGVDQNFALTDQLNIGLRHLEIDITAGYFKLPPKLNEIFVCHTPAPVDALPGQINSAAKAQGIELNWQSKNLSCLGTNVPFQTMLQEVRDWVDANPDEVVILYLDTKPVTVTSKAGADAASKVMRAVFGDLLWSVADGSPLNVTIAEMLRRGKRVVVEDHDDTYNKADDRIVFTPALWDHQFHDSDLQQFPDCSIGGDSDWYTPVGGTPRRLARALYDDGSILGGGKEGTAAVRARTQECGVQVVSPNYIQPSDMAAFVWSWAEGEPSAESGCVTQQASGRWAVRPCGGALPTACRAAGDDRQWILAAPGAGCPAGHTALPPTNGYANALLRAAAKGAAVFLNVSIAGDGPAAALRR